MIDGLIYCRSWQCLKHSSFSLCHCCRMKSSTILSTRCLLKRDIYIYIQFCFFYTSNFLFLFCSYHPSFFYILVSGTSHHCTINVIYTLYFQINILFYFFMNYIFYKGLTDLHKSYKLEFFKLELVPVCCCVKVWEII